MKNKNKIVSIIVAVVVVLAIGGIVWYKLATRQVYVPDIPNSHNLSSISYELPTGIVTVAETEKMDKILNGLSELNLKTQSVSVQDAPTEVENLVSIRLNYKEDAVGSFYLYSKKEKYYIEEPYNGIYKISEDDYDFVVSLIEE
ncbi:MAG: DUF5301 domain-containing protein [Mycoplasmatota bacterium]|nr:DUF5301 domain-containing protein [Mycoplasmatota bacterium]